MKQLKSEFATGPITAFVPALALQRRNPRSHGQPTFVFGFHDGVERLQLYFCPSGFCPSDRPQGVPVDLLSLNVLYASRHVPSAERSTAGHAYITNLGLMPLYADLGMAAALAEQYTDEVQDYLERLLLEEAAQAEAM